MIARIALIICTSITLTSCFAYRWQAHVPEDQLTAPTPKPAQPADQIPKFVKIEPIKARGNHFMITNLSQEMVYVSYKQSVVELAGKSQRVVSGQTIGMNKDRESPDTPIAPNTTAEVSFYAQDDDISRLMQKGSTAISYRVSIRKDDKKPEYAILHGTVEEKELIFTTEVGDVDRVACFLTTGMWCMFISPSDEEHKKAEEKGKQKYGPRATVEYQGRQSSSIDD